MRKSMKTKVSAAILVLLLLLPGCAAGASPSSPAVDTDPSQTRSTAAVEILAGDSFYLRYISTGVFSDQRPTEFVEIKDGPLRFQKYDGDDGDPIITITENSISKVFINGELLQEMHLPQTDSSTPAQLQYTGETGTLTLEETALSFEEYTCSYNGAGFTLSFLFLGDDLWGIRYGDDDRYIRVLELRGDIPAEYEALYTPESPSSPDDPDPGPPVHLQVIPADSLPDEVAADIRLFREQLAGSRYPDEEYFYLYVVDQTGEPVANLQCYPGDINWDHRMYNESMYGYGELSLRLGLSRNSGLLPIPVEKFVGRGTSVLALCNAEGETYLQEWRAVSIQEAEIDGELLEQLKAGDILQFVWEGEKPIDTVLAAEHGYVEVAVTDGDGQPAADRLVYIHSSSKLVGAPDPSGADIFWMDGPYEPRYTDENGIARFVRVNQVGVDDDGNNLIETEEIVVMPCFGLFDDARKKGVYIEIPPTPPLRFEVVLD